MSEWIDVKERLPEFTTDVILADATGYVTVGEFWRSDVDDYYYFNAEFISLDSPITHWKPMPELTLKEGEKMSDWISVKNRLPEFDTQVILADAKGEVVVGELWQSDINGNYFVNDEFISLDGPITHWMPMPEPPHKEETTDDEV